MLPHDRGFFNKLEDDMGKILLKEKRKEQNPEVMEGLASSDSCTVCCSPFQLEGFFLTKVFHD